MYTRENIYVHSIPVCSATHSEVQSTMYLAHLQKAALFSAQFINGHNGDPDDGAKRHQPAQAVRPGWVPVIVPVTGASPSRPSKQ